jgi:anti-sigma factor RsiW
MSGPESRDQQQAEDARPLTCQELVELVTAYRDGALPPDEQQRFDEHLAVCPPCVRYVEQLDQTVRAVGGLCDDVEREPDTQELLRAFSAWKRETPS